MSEDVDVYDEDEAQAEGTSSAHDGATNEAAPGAEEAEVHYPSFAVVGVANVHMTLPDQYPSVVLAEQVLPFRSLVFPVSLADGAAIAAVLEDRPSPRPSSQDLLGQILAGMNIDVVAARITAKVNGTYLAELDLMGPAGRLVVSCRPSDAINAALRSASRAPMLVDVELFE